MPLRRGLWWPISPPLCQETSELRLLFVDLRCVEEVLWEPDAGVEDFDADEAVVSPVEHDERLDAPGRLGFDAGRRTGRELLFGEVEVDGVGVAIVGDAHPSILPWLSATSCR